MAQYYPFIYNFATANTPKMDMYSHTYRVCTPALPLTLMGGVYHSIN